MSKLPRNDLLRFTQFVEDGRAFAREFLWQVGGRLAQAIAGEEEDGVIVHGEWLRWKMGPLSPSPCRLSLLTIAASPWYNLYRILYEGIEHVYSNITRD